MMYRISSYSTYGGRI